MTGKCFYSKAETRQRLKVGRARYQQMLDANILAPPVKLTDDARPVHTEAQIQNALLNIDRKYTKALLPSKGRKTKPLSQKLISEIT